MKNVYWLKTIIFILFITVISCQNNDEIVIDSDNLLIGNWTNAIYNSDTETTTFKRINKLPNEEYGVSFQKNGTFIQRTSGWCGTPPLIFYNVEGSFLLNNKIIKVTSQEFPGNFNWKIISVNEKQLVVKRELTDQEKDHQKLMLLFSEIEELSTSVTCVNGNDWDFIGYGTKGCGGFQGYIAYSNKIDVAAFLQKVADYTEKEDEYNKKWGIVSDCSVPSEPLEVDCVNGSPVLKY